MNLKDDREIPTLFNGVKLTKKEKELLNLHLKYLIVRVYSKVTPTDNLGTILRRDARNLFNKGLINISEPAPGFVGMSTLKPEIRNLLVKLPLVKI